VREQAGVDVPNVAGTSAIGADTADLAEPAAPLDHRKASEYPFPEGLEHG
jgi:hypothetical protein